jgi:hypothetical protein
MGEGVRDLMGSWQGGDKFGGINSACFYSVSLKLNKVGNIIPSE